MFPIVRLLAICAVFAVVTCNPLRRITEKRVNLLGRYGYLESRGNGSAGAYSLAELTEAVKNIQEFAGLNATGELDSETITLLESDRCGMPDNYTQTKRSGSFGVGEALIGQYYLQGSYWRKRDLTYKVIRYTANSQHRLSEAQQRHIFKTSMDMWQAATSLTLIDVTDDDIRNDDVDILISFVARSHGDAYPFDGRGGTLAHAFYPHNNQGLSGDAHFDDAEDYTTGTTAGINLDWVALHEFGHSLGLEHSGVRESIMYPWYKGYKENIELTYDDILGIQALYGRPSSPTTSTGPTTTQVTTQTTQSTTVESTAQVSTTASPVLPDYCNLLSYDAFFNGLDGKTYAVSGEYYWHILRPYAGLESGPHRLDEKFPGLPTPVDAAFTKHERTFFFKGSSYWKYKYINNQFIAEDSPRSIDDKSGLGLPANLNGMDAAFVYKNTRTYYFKGQQYWRYNDALGRIDVGYPKDISVGWTGAQGPYQAAMTWGSNDRTYFFEGEEYVRVSQTAHGLDDGFPQNIALKWMKCNPNVGGLAIGSLSTGNGGAP